MKKLILCLMLFAINGCAVSGYGKYSQLSGTGYKEVRIDSNTFKVYYEASSRYSLEETRDLALRRAAELTKMNGYLYFTVLEDKSYLDPVTYTENEKHVTETYVDEETGYMQSVTTIVPAETYTKEYPYAVLIIDMSNENLPGNIDHYNADIILSNYQK